MTSKVLFYSKIQGNYSFVLLAFVVLFSLRGQANQCRAQFLALQQLPATPISENSALTSRFYGGQVLGPEGTSDEQTVKNWIKRLTNNGIMFSDLHKTAYLGAFLDFYDERFPRSRTKSRYRGLNWESRSTRAAENSRRMIKKFGRDYYKDYYEILSEKVQQESGGNFDISPMVDQMYSYLLDFYFLGDSDERRHENSEAWRAHHFNLNLGEFGVQKKILSELLETPGGPELLKGLLVVTTPSLHRHFMTQAKASMDRINLANMILSFVAIPPVSIIGAFIDPLAAMSADLFLVLWSGAGKYVLSATLPGIRARLSDSRNRYLLRKYGVQGIRQLGSRSIESVGRINGMNNGIKEIRAALERLESILSDGDLNQGTLEEVERTLQVINRKIFDQVTAFQSEVLQDDFGSNYFEAFSNARSESMTRKQLNEMRRSLNSQVRQMTESLPLFYPITGMLLKIESLIEGLDEKINALERVDNRVDLSDAVYGVLRESAALRKSLGRVRSIDESFTHTYETLIEVRHSLGETETRESPSELLKRGQQYREEVSNLIGRD